MFNYLYHLLTNKTKVKCSNCENLIYVSVYNSNNTYSCGTSCTFILSKK